MENPCDAKKFYDTEFEATIAAAKTSHRFDTEMVPYRHNSHWHIANKRKDLRSKHRTFNRTWCEACHTYMKPGQWEKHVKKERHKYLVRRQQREEAE